MYFLWDHCIVRLLTRVPVAYGECRVTVEWLV